MRVHAFRLAIAASVLLLSVASAFAGAWEAAEAFRKQDYAGVRSACEAAAKSGDASCQNFLGILYSAGFGVKKDMKEAARWFRLAAEQGNGWAALNLGRDYELGEGVAKDAEQAEKWYRVSAEQGVPEGEASLGALLISQHRDAREAVKWFRAAAKQGLPIGQTMLGQAYEAGISVKANPRTAAKWYELAADHGESIAQTRLARLYERGEGVDVDLQEAYFWYAVTLRDPKNPHAKENAEALKRLAAKLAKEDIADATKLAAEFQPQEAEIGPPSRSARRGSARKRKGSPSDEAEAGPYATGSGFIVSRKGFVVTNNHVVRQCREVRVTEGDKSTPVKIVATDAERDLALVQLPHEVPAAAAFRADDKLHPGESVVVIGFPLSGLLSSDPIVTTGIVSALAGPRDNRRLMQISAPIQPGNSGGPLIDSNGTIIGVIVSTLSTVRLAAVTGAIPENINFAIKGEEAKQFLAAQGVIVATAPAAAKEPGTAVIAERALAVTVRLECWK